MTVDDAERALAEANAIGESNARAGELLRAADALTKEAAHLLSTNTARLEALRARREGRLQ